MAAYKSLNHIIRTLAASMRPPERLTVAAAAEKYRFVNQPGAYVGPWDNGTAPYMVEPMNIMADREINQMAFVGPAQSGKTDALIINGVTYSVTVDPIDTMVYCPTNTAARDFSMRRIDRLHTHSPAVGAKMLKTRDADNVFDKHYVTGMMLTLSWPSVTELAGRPVGRIIMTDFDRMDDDIGGDGNAFDLAAKRTTTFGSFAMCAAESSPSRPILDPKWIQKSPHEAPPCTGIIALYNRGDRRLWHWPCPDCGSWFEGRFELLRWDESAGSNLDMADTAHMICPHCGVLIHPDNRKEMNMWGVWVPEGMRVDDNGRLIGHKPRTKFASFWLRGVAAAFVSWPKLVLMYLDAMDEYSRTLSEEALKKFWNNDMGQPYVPVSADSLRVPETLMAQAEELPAAMVPESVRFLVATVDVQKGSFVVQVHGVSAGTPFDMTIIDRFEIVKSNRLDEDGERMPLRPANYLDDWDLIRQQVMDKEYELADGSGRWMGIKMTGCDSGGRAGVTDRAYDFYRKLRSENQHGRFTLIKGDPSPRAPRTRVSYPDSQRKDNKSAARGDIPVLMLNSNMIKDMLNNRLNCVSPGKGMVHIPKWLPDSWFSEMCVEVRTDKGWTNPNKARNEAWDLCNYLIGICISAKHLRVDAIDWENPPIWAAGHDHNALVRTADAIKRFAVSDRDQYDFAKFAEDLA